MNEEKQVLRYEVYSPTWGRFGQKRKDFTEGKTYPILKEKKSGNHSLNIYYLTISDAGVEALIHSDNFVPEIQLLGESLPESEDLRKIHTEAMESGRLEESGVEHFFCKDYQCRIDSLDKLVLAGLEKSTCEIVDDMISKRVISLQNLHKDIEEIQKTIKEKEWELFALLKELGYSDIKVDEQCHYVKAYKHRFSEKWPKAKNFL